MRTDHHFTVAKPSPPWGLASQLMIGIGKTRG